MPSRIILFSLWIMAFARPLPLLVTSYTCNTTSVIPSFPFLCRQETTTMQCSLILSLFPFLEADTVRNKQKITNDFQSLVLVSPYKIVMERTTTKVAPLGAYYRAFKHREATERNSKKQTHRLPRSRAGALVLLTNQTREKRNRNKIPLHKLHCFLSYIYCKCTSSIACFHMRREAPVDFRSLLKLKNRNQKQEATTSIKFISTSASRSEQFFILSIPFIPSLR